MTRGTTARALLTALAAVLMALQFIAPTATAATAHDGYRHAASAETAVEVPAETDRVTCGEKRHPESRTAPFRVRERHRPAQYVPDTPARTPPVRDLAAGYDHGAPAPATLRATRPSPDRTAAALQVFRC